MSDSSFLFNVKFFPQAAADILSPHQKASISGIVFERYVEHMLNHFARISKMEKITEIYSRKPISKIFESVGLDIEDMFSIWVDGAVFLTSSPLEWLSTKHLIELVEKNSLYWWEKEATQKILNNSFGRLTVTSFDHDKHRPDFVFIGKKRSKIYAFIGDAKFRSGTREQRSKKTSLSADDIRRLMVYYRILQYIAYHKKWKLGYVYIFGNQPSVAQWSYRVEEDEESNNEDELVTYRSWDVKVEKVHDSLWGNIQEMTLYPKGTLEKGKEMDPIFTIRYVPMLQLVEQGLVDPYIAVVIAPRFSGSRDEEVDIHPPYYVVSNVIPSETKGIFRFKGGSVLEGYVLGSGNVTLTPENTRIVYNAFVSGKQKVELMDADLSIQDALEKQYMDILKFIKRDQPIPYWELSKTFGRERVQRFMSIAHEHGWIKFLGHNIVLTQAILARL